jgi:hypothetical protein
LRTFFVGWETWLAGRKQQSGESYIRGAVMEPV